ncbi:TPA: hypothetical protein ACFIWT_001762, partial [Neisseria gonorrhoeae]
MVKQAVIVNGIAVYRQCAARPARKMPVNLPPPNATAHKNAHQARHYSGLTKIRTRRRAADGTNGTEPIRLALQRLRESFSLSQGGAVPYRFLLIRYISSFAQPGVSHLHKPKSHITFFASLFQLLFLHHSHETENQKPVIPAQA